MTDGSNDQGPRLARRTLLVLGSATVAGLAGGCAILRGGASHPRYAPAASALRGTTLAVPMSELSSLADGAALLVQPPTPHAELLIARQGGEYRVVDADCTHWGCTLDWSAPAEEWQCPCHGSRFALDGRVLEGPAEEPLKAHATRIEGGELLIAL